MVAVSSCLIGEKCRYNATGSLNQPLIDSLTEGYIDLCPELLAGLPIPRLPCEIVGGEGKDVIAGDAKIIDSEGNDLTAKMLLGARLALDICKTGNVTKAYLKRNSPTCGSGEIYDGSFTSKRRSGHGVFAQMLIDNGVQVVEV